MASIVWYAYKSGSQYTSITVDYTENIYATYSTITINDISCYSTYIATSSSYYWTGLKLQVAWDSTTQTIIDGMYFPMAGGSSNSNDLAVTTTSQIPTGSTISFILSGTLAFHGNISRESLTIGSSTGSSATTQTISRHSHSWSSTVTKAATCGTTGIRTYTCSSCGNSYTEIIAATGNHSYADATCTNPQTCTQCGATTGSALGHSWNSGVVTTEPTYTADGVMTYTCSRCSATKTDLIQRLGARKRLVPVVYVGTEEYIPYVFEDSVWHTYDPNIHNGSIFESY